MKLLIATKVKSNLNQVKVGFNKVLFKKLSPPFPPVKILRFDGCKAGDKVILELSFLFTRQIWESHITEDRTTETQWEFIDIGVRLPFFLRRWNHTHRVILSEDKKTCTIQDLIEFSSGYFLTDFLLYPLLYLQFAYRIPIYQRYFADKNELN